MFSQFLNQTMDMHQSSDAFALAFVVRREVPSSGKPGDKAIITADGQIKGWIGGGCTRGIILKEALSAIQDGKPRLVRISPDGQQTPQKGIIDYKMTCQSGGSVEVYIEPVLPKPHLLIMGQSHVAMALCRLGKALDYTVSVVSPGVDESAFPLADQLVDSWTFPSDLIGRHTYIVVSTQGEGDEEALQAALAAERPYLAFVASRRKANAIFNYLRQAGASVDRLRTIKTPAGLDIGAKLPEEVAISILAQIIADLREEKETATADAPQALSNHPDYFVNPVCNIPVQKSTAKHVIEFQEKKYYFCCDGCKVSFEKAPEQYALQES